MNIIFAMLNGWEIVLILILAVVLFGSKKLPELARGLGQGIREFKKSTREITDELESAVDLDAPPTPARRLPEQPSVTADTTRPASTQTQSPPSQSPKV